MVSHLRTFWASQKQRCRKKLGPENFGPKNVGPKKVWWENKNWSPKHFDLRFLVITKKIGFTKIFGKKISCQKLFLSNKCLVKIFLSKTFLCPKKFEVKWNFGSKFFAQNRIIILKNFSKISNQNKVWANFGSRKISVKRGWVQKMSPNKFEVKK